MTQTALDYAIMCADTLLRTFTVEELPPKGRFHYHQGVFLSGVQRTYRLSGEKRFNDYITAWLNFHIDENGDIPSCLGDQFDDMQPAILLFYLYEATGLDRYQKVLDRFADIVGKWPKNAMGGFWHKFFRPNQMWLDTLYMVGPFMSQYADRFDRPYFHEIIFRQMQLMQTYMTDPKTGLLYHAWDDSKKADWANETTGTSSEFWGRAIGWYAVALLDILEHMDDKHPRRESFMDAARDILNALIRYQDKETGLWYQLVNRAGEEGNWLENSCSCLYTYALGKAMEMDILDLSYAPHMRAGYHGVIQTLLFMGDDLILPNVCVGTGVGDKQFYFDRPAVQNDLHGLGAFLLMCTQVHSTCMHFALQE